MGQQLSQILTRHQQRREQMIPTVSILKGPISTSIAEWHNFTHRLNRLAAIIDQPDWDSILSAFLKNYKGRRSLVNAALKKLTRDIRMD